MKNRSELSHPIYWPSSRLQADLDVEASDELRELASQTARTVHNEMNRMWRARRRPSPGRSKFMRRVGVPLTLFFCLCLSLQGVTCDRAGCGTIRQGNAIVCFTPARPTSLYGELKAVDPNPLPAERDTTNFNEVSEYYYRRNWFFGMDIENGWILAGLAHGIGIWDARTNPSRPTFVSSRLYGPGQASRRFPQGSPRKSSSAASMPRTIRSRRWLDTAARAFWSSIFPTRPTPGPPIRTRAEPAAIPFTQQK